jgi:outer membrane lipoprotein-sorting protein
MIRTAASLLLLLLAACAPRPPVPAVVAPPVSEEILLENLAQNARAFHSLQGVAKVRVAAGGKSMAGTQVLFVEKPDRFRAETLSPFGQPLLLMATNGQEMDVMVPSEGRFYRGEASPSNVQRFTRLPLRLTDLVHLLLYQVPVIGHGERTLEAGEDGGFLLTLSGEGGRRQKLRFNTALRLVETIYVRNDVLQLRVSYDQFQGDLHSFPRAVFLEMPPLNAEGSLVFSEVRTNVVIPEDRFSLSPGPGMEIQPIP